LFKSAVVAICTGAVRDPAQGCVFVLAVACHCGRHSLSGLPLTPAYSTACHCHTGLPFRRFTACICHTGLPFRHFTACNCHTGSHFPSHCMPLPASLAPILPTYCHTGSHFPSLCMIRCHTGSHFPTHCMPLPLWLSFPISLHATATLALISLFTSWHCHTGSHFPTHCMPLPHWLPIFPHSTVCHGVPHRLLFPIPLHGTA
jgi:hypothetical protein